MACDPVTCQAQQIITPQLTYVDGQPVYSKQRAVSIRQGQTVKLQWQMLDRNCSPVDLSDCGIVDNDLVLDGSSIAASGTGILFRLMERVGSNTVKTVMDGKVLDASTGLVEVKLDSTMTASPGIYFAEVAIVNDAGEVIHSNTFLLLIEPSTLQGGTTSGMPTVAEIRLHMHDNGPADNLLLDDFEFDLADISAAIMRPVDYWNDALPPIYPYTTENFPFRARWLDGIIANLLMMAAMRYRRNHLPYSAGGVSVDDQNKFNQYDQIGRQMWDEYKSWVRQRKISLNMQDTFGSLHSEYGGWWGYHCD